MLEFCRRSYSSLDLILVLLHLKLGLKGGGYAIGSSPCGRIKSGMPRGLPVLAFNVKSPGSACLQQITKDRSPEFRPDVVFMSQNPLLSLLSL